jgi:deazaflavin-dependent oxidoreductase (nitroreductase family)
LSSCTAGMLTHWGNKTGAIRKTPLMRVKDGDNYILVGSQGGAPKDPAWAHNLRVNPHIELRDETIVRPMHVREDPRQLENRSDLANQVIFGNNILKTK